MCSFGRHVCEFCHENTYSRIEQNQTTQFLFEHLAEEFHSQIPLLLNLSNQMPLFALELAEKDWVGKRSSFIQDWQKLVIQKNMPMAISSKWNKELSFSDFTQMFEYLLADLICVKLDQHVKNIDIDFNVLAEQYSLEALFTIYSELQQAKKLIQQNVQGNLVVDQLCIKLMDI